MEKSQGYDEKTPAKKVAISIDDGSLVALDDLSDRHGLSRSEMSRRIVGNCATANGQARLQQFYREFGRQIDFEGRARVMGFQWPSNVDTSLSEVAKKFRSAGKANRSEAFRMMIMLHAVEGDVVQLSPHQRLRVKRIAAAPGFDQIGVKSV